MRKSKIILFLVLFSCVYASAQVVDFKVKHELKDISSEWHKLELPNTVYAKVSKNFSDVRVYGIDASTDTIEAPYLINIAEEKVQINEVPITLLNTSNNKEGYYFTFSLPENESYNQIQLDFEEDNFDWRVTLEGSQDQNEWFKFVDEFRILSIKNQSTDFQFTTIPFSTSTYRYVRMKIVHDEQPVLQEATIALKQVEQGKYKNYTIAQQTRNEIKKTKQSEIEISLARKAPVSKLTLQVNETIDYYRPIRIQYLVDSVHTDKGWKYNYKSLTRATISSLKKNEFAFKSTIAKKLKVIIDNRDNQALQIGDIKVDGYIHELQIRFSEKADYFLAYGGKDVRKPSYDIANFKDRIPENPSAIKIGEAQIISSLSSSTTPLFANKIWLWLVMIIIISMLGWFSLKMIKNG